MKSDRAFVGLLALSIGVLSSIASAQQDETYRFDGVADMDPQPDDPTDWMTSVNWSDGGADPFPPFGPEIPDFGTRVEIQTSTFGVDAPEIGPGDTAEAFGVRIGRFGGEGLLTMSGGTLDIANSCTAAPFSCSRRIRVGAADVALPQDRNPGTFNITGGVITTDTFWIGSGSQGTVNLSNATINTRGNFYLDWSFDASSVLNMTSGTINVGTDFRMYRNSVLNLDGGEILVEDELGLGTTTGLNNVQSPNITATITGGLLETSDELFIGGDISLSGGILRADMFSELDATGAIDITGSGLLQFNNANEDVAAVQGFITSGLITTTGGDPLMVSVVDVGGTDFTQVSAGAAGVAGDFDGDGDVDVADALLGQRDGEPLGVGSDWEVNFGTGEAVAAVAAVPEPTSLSLAFGLALGVSSSALCRRR